RPSAAAGRRAPPGGRPHGAGAKPRTPSRGAQTTPRPLPPPTPPPQPAATRREPPRAAPVTASTADTLGTESAAATSTTSCTVAGNAASRRRTSSCNGAVTGSRSPGSNQPPVRRNALASSTAENALPPP